MNKKEKIITKVEPLEIILKQIPYVLEQVPCLLIPDWICPIKGLNWDAKFILSLLMQRCAPDGVSFVPRKIISKDLNIKESTVSRQINSLIKKKFIERSASRKDCYHFLWHEAIKKFYKCSDKIKEMENE